MLGMQTALSGVVTCGRNHVLWHFSQLVCPATLQLC